MTTIRKIVTSKIDGENSNNTSINEIRPYGEIAVYVGNDDKLELLMFDGVRTHVKSKVLNKGTFYGGDGDSGDGAGLDTIKLIPDAELYNNSGGSSHQYIIVDPTAPNHIHLRAGGTIDQSFADLFLGGEKNHVKVSDGYDNVQITTDAGEGTYTWTFDNNGKLTFPGGSYSSYPSRISANFGIVLEPTFNGSGTGPHLRVDYNDGIIVSPTTNDYIVGDKATGLYLEGAYLSSGTVLPGDVFIDGGWNSNTQAKGAVNIGRGRTGTVNIGQTGVNTTITFADGTEQTTAYVPTDLTGYATETYVNTQVSNLVNAAPTTLDTLNELAAALGNDANFATSVSTAIGLKANTADLASVATSGSYTDLTDKPTLFSGSYNDLTDTPTIPTNTNELTNDAGFITSSSLTGYATETYVTTAIGNIPPVDFTGYATETYVTTAIGNIPAGFSGSYNDLTDKPTIPTNTNELTNDAGFITSSSLTGYATETYVNTQVSNLVNAAPTTLDTLNELAAALGDDPNFATTVSNQIGLKANTADLATVATSGSYNDLTDKPTIPSLTGYATESYVTTAISAVTATSLGLGNVTNESKATMFSSPTFTGTVSGVTSTMVGLGNVTNESKATMFTSPTFTGTVTLPIISEPLSALSSATGTVTHNLNTSSIFYHTSVAANFTANFTNVPVTTNRVISSTLIIEQGATAYIPNAVQIDGASTTIKWADGTAPTGNVNSVDVVAFSLINNNGTWTVIGALSKFA